MSGAALILLSGGLDSALNLALAAREGTARLALTVAYGQRAEAPELRAAEALAAHYEIPWQAVDLRWLGGIHANALTRGSSDLSLLGADELDHVEKTNASARAVWVANRNGLFLNVAGAFAEARGLARILVGFNREEAATFPDNSRAYVAAASAALQFSTLNKVAVDSFTLDWDKTEILSEAVRVGLPLELVWSCYDAGPKACGVCESCQRFARARSRVL